MNLTWWAEWPGICSDIYRVTTKECYMVQYCFIPIISFEMYARHNFWTKGVCYIPSYPQVTGWAKVRALYFKSRFLFNEDELTAEILHAICERDCFSEKAAKLIKMPTDREIKEKRIAVATLVESGHDVTNIF